MAATGKASAANVSVGKPLGAGGLYWAPAGTTLPTDATTELDAKFKTLGYVNEDGLVNGVDSDTTDIKEWGGATVLKVADSRDETFEYTLIEAGSVDALKHVYGDANVTEKAGAITITHNGAPLPHGVFVAEIMLSGGFVKRIVVPDGQVTEVDSVTYKRDEAIGYKATLTAYPDAKGNTAYEYIAKVAGAGVGA